MVGLEELKKVIREWHKQESDELWLNEVLSEQSLERLAKQLKLLFNVHVEVMPATRDGDEAATGPGVSHVKPKGVRRLKGEGGA